MSRPFRVLLMVGILTQGVAVAWRPCLPWAGMSRPFGVNSGTVSVRVHTENLSAKTRFWAIVVRIFFRNCCFDGWDRLQKLCNQPADCEKEMEGSRLRHLFSTIDRPQAKFSLAGLSVKAITFKFSVLLSPNFLFFEKDFSAILSTSFWNRSFFASQNFRWQVHASEH